jgi:hypothetical protein
MPEFITFKTFNDAPAAWAFTDLLDENGIEYQSEEGNMSSDFIDNQELPVKYIIKIHPNDFTQAAEVLKTSEAGGIKKDYSLFDFTDAELMEILQKPDEWRASDYKRARIRLAEKGVDVSDETIARLKQDREAALKQHNEPQTGWIIAGYICVLAGGVLGLFIGWHLAFQKRTLPDGWWAYEYNDATRRQGKTILRLSMITTIITFFLYLDALSKR